MVRAKFKVAEVKDAGWGEHYPGVKTIVLTPVIDGSEENTAFYAATPGGYINLGVLNAAAAAQFEEGAEYYIDFTRADA